MPRSIHRKPRLPETGTLVAEILTFLGDDPERIGRFLALSGLDVGDLRRVCVTAVFAESLLDHLCAQESLLVAFAETKGYDPASLEAVRQSLAPPPLEG